VKCFPLVLALALSAWTGHGAQGSSHDHQHPGGTGQPLGKAPSFRLIDQHNRAFRLEDLKGKVAFVTFLYTSCTTVCPVIMTKFLGVQKAMRDRVGKDVCFVAITVDLERDTPQALRRFAAKWKVVSPGWIFLTGRPEEIAQAAKSYGVSYRKLPDGEIEHSAVTFLVDRKGKTRSVYGLTAGVDRMAGDARMILLERL
jgi:protein SCO1/2